MITQKYINEISYKIVGAAIEVHKQVGPGLLESVYHSCLTDELQNAGLYVQSQIHIPVSYKGKNLGGILKLDLLINNLINMPKGLLINFHCENITKQLVPLVTEEFSKLPKD